MGVGPERDLEVDRLEEELAALDADGGRLRDALERQVWLAAEAPALLRLLGRGHVQGLRAFKGRSLYLNSQSAPCSRIPRSSRCSTSHVVL